MLGAIEDIFAVNPRQVWITRKSFVEFDAFPYG